MPKSTRHNSKNDSIVLAEGDGTLELSPLDVARVKADAMLRAALECCHQHDRYARLVAGPALEAEHRAADETCVVVTNALIEVAASYGETAKELRPNGADEEWWHRANALWHASREYGRRQTCCERQSQRKGASGKRNRDELGDLVLQFDLEASALLALRHAADAYRKTRPQA